MTDITPSYSAAPAAEYAHQVQEQIRASKRRIQEAWVDLARDLYEFNTEQLWKALGYGTFEEWLATPEIDFERRWVFQLIQNYREYAVLREVPKERLSELEPSKLQTVLPAVRKISNRSRLEGVLADVETLSRSDLRARYSSGGTGTVQGANGSAPDDSTHYDAEREASFVRCPCCGSRVREDMIRGR